MARRRSKKRTHAPPIAASKGAALGGSSGASLLNPKSMVIRIGAGEVGSSVSQLASDVRKVMEPGTASRLKERRANKLRDYVTMCGPLGVTQLLLFSRSESGNVNLRIASTPRGPTLHFRVERYSLSKDVQKAQRHPKGGGKEFTTPPLLVMNSFHAAADANAKVPKHLESLITTMFQSLFPAINPQSTPLTSIRRVLLLNREDPGKDTGSFVLNFRHYAITTKPTGISKALKRLNTAEKLLHSKTLKKGGLPNLGKLQDISDFMVGGLDGEGYVTDGGTSGSEAETDAEVDMVDVRARKALSGRARTSATALDEQEQDGRKLQASSTASNVERRAVKLVELGPRMRLRLIKVEEGLCQGQILWHEHVNKTQDEIKELRHRWEKRQKDKEERKRQQKENVAKKKKTITSKGSNGGTSGDKGAENGEKSDGDYSDEDDMDVDDFYGDGQVEDGADWEDEEYEEDE